MAAKSSPVAAFRRFNRFYTKHVGALDEGYHHSRFSLAEARVLYELGTRDVANATAIRVSLVCAIACMLSNTAQAPGQFPAGSVAYLQPSGCISTVFYRTFRQPRGCI